MKNAANATVAATVDTVQSAMSDFRSVIVAGNVTNMFNGPGTQSYPMSFLHYLIAPLGYNSTDCYTKEQSLVFLSWTQYGIIANSREMTRAYLSIYDQSKPWRDNNGHQLGLRAAHQRVSKTYDRQSGHHLVQWYEFASDA